MHIAASCNLIDYVKTVIFRHLYLKYLNLKRPERSVWDRWFQKVNFYDTYS